MNLKRKYTEILSLEDYFKYDKNKKYKIYIEKKRKHISFNDTTNKKYKVNDQIEQLSDELYEFYY